MSVTLHRRGLELGAVVATVLAYQILAHALDLAWVFIPSAVIGWTAYVAVEGRRDPSRWAAWGFRREGLAAASVAPAVLFLVGATGMAVLGAARGTLGLTGDLGICLALYPAFGLIQQLLLQGFVAGTLADLRPGWSVARVTVLTALAFGAIHLPNGRLMLATTALGAAVTPMYLRSRNLWPLGFVHGWLGALLYFWVFGRDPIAEVFGRLR